MVRFSVPDDLSEHQLEKYLFSFVEHLVEKLQEKQPDRHLDMEAKRDLAKQITQTLMQNRTDFPREKLEDPTFIHKMVITLAIALTLEKKEDRFELWRQLFNKKEINETKDLEKKLTPQELKELKEFMAVCCKDMVNELEKTWKLAKLPQPKPGQKSAAEEMLAKQDDPMVNLFGLVNSYTTGGLAAVVTFFMGNLYGLTDWNPEHGMAQIDQQNKTSDTGFGDPLGLNEIARENYIEAGVYTETPEEIKLDYIHKEQLHPSGPGEHR